MSPGDLRGRWRQRRQPEEFRIGPGYPPAGLRPSPLPGRRDTAGDGAGAGTTGDGAGAGADGLALLAAQAAARAAAQESDAHLADLATQLWRLGRKLAEPQDAGAGPAAAAARRKETRHLRAAQDALGRAGVRAEDHDGTDFDIGLSLDVLAYQPVPGVTRESVHETVRPSVYRDGRRIQMGQVIVAQPEGEQEL